MWLLLPRLTRLPRLLLVRLLPAVPAEQVGSHVEVTQREVNQRVQLVP